MGSEAKVRQYWGNSVRISAIKEVHEGAWMVYWGKNHCFMYSEGAVWTKYKQGNQ